MSLRVVKIKHNLKVSDKSISRATFLYPAFGIKYKIYPSSLLNVVAVNFEYEFLIISLFKVD